MKKERKPLQILFSPEEYGMIDELSEVLGVKTRGKTVKKVLRLFHKKVCGKQAH